MVRWKEIGALCLFGGIATSGIACDDKAKAGGGASGAGMGGAGMSGEGGAGVGGAGDGVVGAAVRASGLCAPFDAVPSPDGGRFYFTALDAEGNGGVYTVPCAGGTATSVATGFGSPVALATSVDGATIFVADLADLETGEHGVISSVPAAGGTPSALGGTKGYEPRGLDVSANDTVWFTGTDPAAKAPGLFKAAGGSVTAVKTGDPFSEPSGVAVNAAGDTAFVADVGSTSAQIFKVSGGTVTSLASGLALGFPAGVTLSKNEQYLFASGIHRETGAAQVYRIKLADGSVDTFDMGIGANVEAGGLRRAKDVDRIVWVKPGECTAPGAGGAVYEIAVAGGMPLCQ